MSSMKDDGAVDGFARGGCFLRVGGSCGDGLGLCGGGGDDWGVCSPFSFFTLGAMASWKIVASLSRAWRSVVIKVSCGIAGWGDRRAWIMSVAARKRMSRAEVLGRGTRCGKNSIVSTIRRALVFGT